MVYLKEEKMLLKNFYSVKNTSESSGIYTTELTINKQHHLYDGHFPDRPVTPGVILMQLFKEEAERLSNSRLQLKTASNIKFMAVVNPNEDENLLLESSVETNDSTVSLKGVAKHRGSIALKISAIYSIL